MDLSKLKDDQKLSLCRKYFYIGFACLPFLWFVNAIWFGWQAFKRESFSQQSSIRLYVIYSSIGAVVWLTAIITWITVFQLKRVEWDAFGDHISFNIPRGIP